MSVPMFSGELEFLSNFAPYPAVLDGRQYPTAEHAFQAAKTLDRGKRTLFYYGAPGVAKRMGRELNLRGNWEAEKFLVMRAVLASKFTLTEGLAGLLLGTGDVELVETNTWHDQIWGSCVCARHADIPGRNALGESLMWLRFYLAGGVKP